MLWFLDTSILVRLANTADARFPLTSGAVTRLRGRGDDLTITAQNLVEFRNVATRPVGLNGLGMSAAEADAESARFETTFRLLPETPDVFPMWKVIVAALGVVGKTVHDARLAAVCHLYAVDSILTFNVGHFTRLTGYGRPIAVVHPTNV